MNLSLLLSVLFILFNVTTADNVVGCGGFVKSDVDINYSFIEMKLYTKEGVLKHKTDCAPNNGYFLIPLYDKGVFVLKVDPPQGWSFDPVSVEFNIDGKTDVCTKGEDINFMFTGFTLFGKVTSKGRQQGPFGVKITLKHYSGTERFTETTEEGFFTFSQVLPGKYQIIASHPTWTFDMSAVDVEVIDDNVEVMDKLTVAGYDVRGHVLSEQQPIQGVDFILFSQTLKAEDVKGCEAIEPRILEKISKKAEGVALCKTKSKKDGFFEFSSVPSGEYTLVPFYEGEVITFDVIPTKLKFKVNYKSVVLKTPFEVHGFSVSGKVINLVNGDGIPDVKILVDGVQKSLSNKDGVYVMENVTSGHYIIQAEKDDIFFQPVKVQMNPNTPHLSDIKPYRYNLCGQLKIEILPPGCLQIHKRKVILTPSEGKKKEAISSTTDNEGRFCFKVSPGVYLIQPVILSQEDSAGLILKPQQQSVEIINEPRLGVIFTQFLATVNGKVNCLEKSCNGLTVSLTSQRQPEPNKVTAMVNDGPDGCSFKFEKILPGKYRAVILQDSWCWKNKSMELVIKDENIDDLQFTQSGFVLKCSLSHNITLKFILEGRSEVVGSFNLTKGVNIFCLNEPGVYTLTPKSCHRFDQNTYKYNTSTPSILSFTATEHLLTVVVNTNQVADDLKIKIRNLKTNTEEIVDKAIKSTKESSGNGTDANKDIRYSYEVSFWAKKDSELEVTPISSELLFYPPIKTVVLKDACPGAYTAFDGHVGVFIDGKIVPALGDVKIIIKPTLSEDLKEVITVVSNEKGSYRVGPLHGNVDYEFSASKEGFILEPIKGNKGHFKAVKLGNIEIKVADESETLLSGVLVSLSGNSYRLNRITSENQSLVFSDLVPGEYFFKPMLKEFLFDPPSQIVKLEEGANFVASSKGKRVAYSCYGLVTSLNGIPQKDIALEAVGLDSCEGTQEETLTDKAGQYRLRGLQPGCKYRVRVKSSNVNTHIERSTPQFVDIQVLKNDIENVRMIVFRETASLEVSGNVVTDQSHLSSIKLLLYREKNLDAPIHSTTVGLTSFFQFPPIARDEQNYVIKMESSLSTHQYNFKLPETSFTASGNRVHVVLEFKPVVDSVDNSQYILLVENVVLKHFYDQESSHSSIIFLPILVVALIVGIYYPKVSMFLRNTVQFLQNEQIPENGDDLVRSRRKRK